MMKGRTSGAPRAGRVLCAAFLIALAAGPVLAQSTRSLVNGGNDMYRDQKFSDAEVNYRKGHFNLGDALTKQGKFDEAVKEYQNALAKAEAKDTKAYAHYNIGNSQMKQQHYQDAVQSYIDALKLDPKDDDTKYNLSYALEKLKVPPPKPQDKNQKKDKDKKDQNKNDKQKQDQDKQKQQQKDQQENQKQQQSPQQQQKQMSRADAQRILDVLKNSEKDVQKKLHTRQAVRPKTDKDW